MAGVENHRVGVVALEFGQLGYQRQQPSERLQMAWKGVLLGLTLFERSGEVFDLRPRLLRVPEPSQGDGLGSSPGGEDRR